MLLRQLPELRIYILYKASSETTDLPLVAHVSTHPPIRVGNRMGINEAAITRSIFPSSATTARSPLGLGPKPKGSRNEPKRKILRERQKQNQKGGG